MILVVLVAWAGGALFIAARRGLGPSLSAASPAPAGARGFDIVVYGGTPSGVMAAVAAARAGAHVALLEPGRHLGGIIASGLGNTDIEARYRSFVGGIPAEFFSLVRNAYQSSPLSVDLDWNVEPSKAEQIFREMAAADGVSVYYAHALQEHAGVVLEGTRIVDLITEGGEHFPARVYVDASYEGDLMAQAGVTYAVGREPSSAYGESLAGVRGVGDGGVNPFDASGSLLPGLSSTLLASPGSGDSNVMAYAYRVCLSSEPSNQVPLVAPSGYDRTRYTLLQEWLDRLAQSEGQPLRLDHVLDLATLPNHKADVLGATTFTLDDVGGNAGYAEATYSDRQKMAAETRRYDAGVLYYLSHDPAVPAGIRTELSGWGLCKDEFTDNGNWPPLLYIREARRLVGEYVLTQADVQTTVIKPDSIGLATYRIDSHAVQNVVVNGAAWEEGVLAASTEPYQIPYRSLIPKAGQVANLIVTVDASASHVAWSSLRMEPHFMVMGQAGGTAAALALGVSGDVGALNVATLQQRLESAGAVLAVPAR